MSKRNWKVERITVSAIVHSTEDREKVGEAISTLFPFEFEIYVTEAKGHYGNPLHFLEVVIENKRKIKEFWNYFISILEDKNVLLNLLEEIVDEYGVLHIRVDKQKAYLGKVEISYGGDSIVIKVKLVTYPSKREKAIEAARELIEKGL